MYCSVVKMVMLVKKGKKKSGVRMLKWIRITEPVLGSGTPNGFFFRDVDLEREI